MKQKTIAYFSVSVLATSIAAYSLSVYQNEVNGVSFANETHDVVEQSVGAQAASVAEASARLVLTEKSSPTAMLDIAVIDDKALNFLQAERVAGRYYVSPSDIRELPSSAAVVQLKSASFVLEQDYIPGIEGDREYIYLKTHGPLTAEQRAQLTAVGIELDNFIYANTWVVNVSAEEVEALSRLDFISALGERSAKDKFSASVLKNGFRPSAQSDTVAFVAKVYHDDQLQELINYTVDNALVSSAENIHKIGQKSVVIEIDRSRLEDLARLNIVSWIEHKPAENTTSNAAAAILSNVDDIRLNFSLTGAGLALGIWDGGRVDNTHGDLTGRVILHDELDADPEWHATHVAGTMMGSGLGDIDAQGMATAARLHSYDWADDSLEMRAAAQANQLVISNHSYGTRVGWWWDREDRLWNFSDNQHLFGLYNDKASEWDDIVFDTDLIIFKSAGNDRSDDGGGTATPEQPADGGASGYDTVSTFGTAKNIITVGATVDSGLTTTSFSGWGPVDGGRIKPDIVADGTSLLSTFVGGGYETASGTSMSTPLTSGAAALVYQRFEQVYSVAPEASMLKAILLHSAQDRGTAGPDYQFGWGLLDVQAAVNLVNLGTPNLFPVDINNAELSQSFTFSVDTFLPELRVTAVWTDPQGSSAAIQALVNNINIRLESPSGITFLPWVKDADNPAAAATRGNNDIDNIEQVLVVNPEQGRWTLTVSAAGLASGTNQRVNLASNIAVLGPDADNDRLLDDVEMAMGFNANNPDMDDDGLTDYQEVCFDGDCTNYSPYPNGLDTNVIVSDTDNDGLDDGAEVSLGRNPFVNEPVLITIISTLLMH